MTAQHKDQLAANDVKWSHGRFDTTIATAAANGRIVVYDLNRAGVELVRLHEHTRQVHRLAFNPHQGALLLSGSQDATTRMWDLRDMSGERSVRTCGSIKSFSGYNEGIRDIRWSPSDGVEFAAGTDNGVVQKWDFRKEAAPILKINAHDKTCHSINWHPSGKFLASGGADKNVKIWDFKSTDRRMKPVWQLRAPQAVLNIRWRPGHVPPTEDAPSIARNSSCYLATSYDNKDPRIHVWDFRRPHVAFQELDRCDSPPSDFLWPSEDLLWSVGHAGMFTQTDLNLSPKGLSRKNINVVNASSTGRICIFVQERPRKRTSLGNADHFLQRISPGEDSGERFSGSHSATEGSLDEGNFMSSSLKKRRQRINSTRLTSSPSSTGHVHDLRHEDLFGLEPTFFSSQSSAEGSILGASDVSAFRHLAQNYELPSAEEISQNDGKFYETLGNLFEKHAKLAVDTGQHRLAQTWRILGIVVQRELLARARASRHARISSSVLSTQISIKTAPEDKATNAKSDGDAHNNKATLKALRRESLSSMPTPLAKAVQSLPVVPMAQLTGLDHEGDKNASHLGPTWYVRGPSVRLTSPKQPQPTPPNTSPQAFDGPNVDVGEQSNQTAKGDTPPPFQNFDDMEKHILERRNAMNNYRVKPRTILRFDDPYEGAQGTSNSLGVAPRLDRHDSNESFQMFSASSDSDHRSIPFAGSYGETHASGLAESLQDRWSSTARMDFAYNDSFNKYPEQESRNSFSPLAQGSFENQHSPITFKKQMPLQATSSRTFSPVRRPSKPMPPVVYTRKSTSTALCPLTSEFLYTDFLTPIECPTSPAPWSLSFLIPPLLTFHLDLLSDPQLPSLLTLHLGPLYPSLFSRPRSIAYLRAYHSRLVAQRLFADAAALRNACYPSFPEITRLSAGPDVAALFCRICNKPVKGEQPGRCARCRSSWGPCAVCEEPEPPPELLRNAFTTASSSSLAAVTQRIVGASAPPSVPAPGRASKPHSPPAVMTTRLWVWCPGCGHGGHSACLHAWWADVEGSGGSCAVLGCAHDCVAGRRREEKRSEAERERRRARVKVVKDEWKVGESRAVERARGMVGRVVGGVGAGIVAVGKDGEAMVDTPLGSSSRMGGSASVGERVDGVGSGNGGASMGIGRRVRLVVPDEERDGMQIREENASAP